MGAALWLASGCAARTLEPAGQPVADPAATAAEVQAQTTPTGPRRAVFSWTLNEQGTRLGGRGVVRYVAPERLRLDLFGPRGETYLAAALVGEEYRLPPGVTGAFELPSPALLWAALGVVRPPADARLLGASLADEVTVLRYGVADDVLEFRAAPGPSGLRLRRVQRAARSGVVESLDVSSGPTGTPQQTRYRNWEAYRDLTLDVEGITDEETFPEEIWLPGGGAR